jgi:hypothetical protein
VAAAPSAETIFPIVADKGNGHLKLEFIAVIAGAACW